MKAVPVRKSIEQFSVWQLNEIQENHTKRDDPVPRLINLINCSIYVMTK